MATFSIIKDPDANLDYQMNWTAWLNGDTISSSSVTVPDGLTKESESDTDATQTVWLSGGTVGTVYSVLFEITTALGRIEQRTLMIIIRER